ncbi:hypothetical protein V1264_005289 [Littorina saxatilis]|uniref:C1q domain-containing protein n=2 Tax=Littorina saxatilis TaxID=31220 RepID=A0AAN9B148_9CAEN
MNIFKTDATASQQNADNSQKPKNSSQTDATAETKTDSQNATTTTNDTHKTQNQTQKQTNGYKEQLTTANNVKYKTNANAIQDELEKMQQKLGHQLQALNKTQGKLNQSLQTLIQSQQKVQEQEKQLDAALQKFAADGVALTTLTRPYELGRPDGSLGFHVKVGKPWRFPVGQAILFDRVLYNDGQVYNSTNGSFTAQVPGLYNFSLHVALPFPSPRFPDNKIPRPFQAAHLMVGQNLCLANATMSTLIGRQFMGFCHATVKLAPGQSVWVKNVGGPYTMRGGDATFNGTLVHPVLLG